MASAQQHALTLSQASTSGNSLLIPSIWDKLRAPTASEIMRKRKVRVNNPPHTGARKKLPTWSSVKADILLVQPSSAAAECVFSLLKASFGPQQDSALNDYIETSLMLQYNKDT